MELDGESVDDDIDGEGDEEDDKAGLGAEPWSIGIT